MPGCATNSWTAASTRPPGPASCRSRRGVDVPRGVSCRKRSPRSRLDAEMETSRNSNISVTNLGQLPELRPEQHGTSWSPNTTGVGLTIETGVGHSTPKIPVFVCAVGGSGFPPSSVSPCSAHITMVSLHVYSIVHVTQTRSPALRTGSPRRVRSHRSHRGGGGTQNSRGPSSKSEGFGLPSEQHPSSVEVSPLQWLLGVSKVATVTSMLVRSWMVLVMLGPLYASVFRTWLGPLDRCPGVSNYNFLEPQGDCQQRWVRTRTFDCPSWVPLVTGPS